jgi:hypothetical protein
MKRGVADCQRSVVRTTVMFFAVTKAPSRLSCHSRMYARVRSVSALELPYLDHLQHKTSMFPPLPLPPQISSSNRGVNATRNSRGSTRRVKPRRRKIPVGSRLGWGSTYALAAQLFDLNQLEPLVLMAVCGNHFCSDLKDGQHVVLSQSSFDCAQSCAGQKTMVRVR